MGSTTKEMKLMNVNELIPYVNNTRTHSPEQINKLRGSLREFGFINPVIIDSDKNVLAGHARLEAAKAEGITKVPCVLADHLSDAQKKAYIIADNRYAEDAGWDEELLRVEIEALEEMGFDLELTGFDESEIADLFKEDGSGAEDDDFDLNAALEKASFVKHGDIWSVGRHRLICGDATSSEDINKLMGDKKANLMLTDPPYGVSFKSWDGLTIENDSLENEDFYKFLMDSFKNMTDHMQAGGCSYVFHADILGEVFRHAFKDAGLHLSAVCIWVKNSLVPGWGDFQYKHEPILYGYLPTGKHVYYGDRKQTTVWNFDKQHTFHNHPTSKPLDLLGYAIENSTQENGIVIDAFGGSGSTMMACEQMNRTCYMAELDEKYASVILRRYVEMTGDATGVSVERDGKTLAYNELVIELDEDSDN